MPRTTFPAGQGLITNASRVALPPGALKQAKNVQIRNGRILPRRPLRQYDASRQWVFGFYNGDGITTVNGNRFFIDSSGNVLRDTGTLHGSPTLTDIGGLDVNVGNDAGEQVATFEMNGNTYFNAPFNHATYGVLKLDKTDGTAGPKVAGMQRGLDLTLTITGTNGFLATNATCAYRLIWVYEDNNKTTIRGEPSSRFQITNTGAAQNVLVKSTIPSEITSGLAGVVFYLVYRAKQVTTGAPAEEYFLCDGNYLTTTDISNGYVQFTDVTPDAMLGEHLYTNPTKEGALAANAQPPVGNDATVFKGMAIYADTYGKHRKLIRMLAAPDQLVVSTGAGGFTKSGGNMVVTFTGSPDLSGITTAGVLAINDATSSSGGTNNVGVFPIVSVDDGAKTITATNANAVTEAGKSTSRGIASGLTIATVRYNSVFTEDIPNKRYAAGITGTVSTDVRTTTDSLVKCINQNASATVYAHHEWIEDVPGGIALEERGFGGSAFTVQAFGNTTSVASGASTYASKFAPDLSSGASSDNDAKANRFYYSKVGNAEHVPLVRFWDAGKRQSRIIRAVALRQTLYFFKPDGLFASNSDGTGMYPPVLVDETIQIPSAGCVNVLNNRIYAITTKGLMVISDGGAASVISEPVDDQWRPYVETWSGEGGGLRSHYVSVSEADGRVYFSLAGPNVGPPSSAVYAGYPGVCLAYDVRDGLWSTADHAGSSFQPPWMGRCVVMNHRPFWFSTDLVPVASGGNRRLYLEEHIDWDSTGISTAESVFRFPLPGDRLIANVTAVNSGASQITIAAPAPYFVPSVGDLFYTGKNTLSLWAATAVASAGGSNYTVTLSASRINGGDTVGSVFSVGKAWFIISTSAVVEPYPAVGEPNNMRRYSRTLTHLDNSNDATAITMGFYNDTESTVESAATTSNKKVVVAMVPQGKQFCDRLGMVITHSERARYCVIDAFSYDWTPEENAPAPS